MHFYCTGTVCLNRSSSFAIECKFVLLNCTLIGHSMCHSGTPIHSHYSMNVNNVVYAACLLILDSDANLDNLFSFGKQNPGIFFKGMAVLGIPASWSELLDPILTVPHSGTVLKQQVKRIPLSVIVPELAFERTRSLTIRSDIHETYIHRHTQDVYAKPDRDIMNSICHLPQRRQQASCPIRLVLASFWRCLRWKWPPSLTHIHVTIQNNVHVRKVFDSTILRAHTGSRRPCSANTQLPFSRHDFVYACVGYTWL